MTYKEYIKLLAVADTYVKDGAWFTAALRLRKLADKLEAEAVKRNAEMDEQLTREDTKK